MKKQAGSGGLKTLVTVCCECKLEKNNILMPDTSLDKSQQNKAKILTLQERCENGTTDIYVKLINSKTKDTFCLIRKSDIVQLYSTMICEGKITLLAKMRGDPQSTLKMLISNAPSELLNQICILLSAGSTSPHITSASGCESNPTSVSVVVQSKPPASTPQSAKSLQAERKRQLALLYREEREVGQTAEPKVKREKASKPRPEERKSAPKTLLTGLPSCILGMILEYISCKSGELSFICKSFQAVCDERQERLVITNKLIPPASLLALLTRFRNLRSLTLGKLTAVPNSTFGSLPASIAKLETLDVSEMSVLRDCGLTAILTVANQLRTLKLPHFGTLTGQSLPSCLTLCPKLTTFALTSTTLSNQHTPGAITSEALCDFLSKAQPLQALELYYVNEAILNAIAQFQNNIQGLTIHILNPNMSMSKLAALTKVKRLSVALRMLQRTNKPNQHSGQELASLLLLWPENTLKEAELGETADSLVIDALCTRHNSSLKSLILHSTNIRNADVERIAESCHALEHLDLTGCLITEMVAADLKTMQLKTLSIKLEIYKMFAFRQELIELLPHTHIEFH